MAHGAGKGARSEPVLTIGFHSLTLAQTLRSARRTQHFAGGPQGRSDKMWSKSTFAPNTPLAYTLALSVPDLDVGYSPTFRMGLPQKNTSSW